MPSLAELLAGKIVEGLGPAEAEAAPKLPKGLKPKGMIPPEEYLKNLPKEELDRLWEYARSLVKDKKLKEPITKEMVPERLKKFFPVVGGGLVASQLLEPEEAEAAGPEAIWRKVVKEQVPEKLKKIYRIMQPMELMRPVSKESAQWPGTGMTALEPGGLYFAKEFGDLPMLLNPDIVIGHPWSAKQTMKELKTNFGYKKMSEAIIRGEIKPEAKVLNAENVEIWYNTLDQFSKTLKGKQKATFQNLLEDTKAGNWLEEISTPEEEAIQRKLTNWLSKQYDVAIFPDVAMGAGHLPQVVALNPGAVIGRTKKQGKWITRTLGVAGGGLLASQLGEEEAEAAPLTKPVREIYRQVSKEGKRIYHITDPRTAEKLLEKGIENPRIAKHFWEDWKPLGVYFSPNLESAAKLAPTGLGGEYTTVRKVLGRRHPNAPVDVVRGVLKSDRVLEIDESKLKQAFSDFANMNKPSEATSLKLLDETELNKLNQKWSRVLSKKYDAIIVNNVDGIKEAQEVIAMNPKSVKLFYKNLRWPIIAGATTVGASLGLDQEAAASGLMSPINLVGEAEAAPKLNKILFDQLWGSINRTEDEFLKQEFRQLLSKYGLTVENKTLADYARILEKEFPRTIKKVIPGAIIGGGLLTSQQKAEASGLQPPINLTGEALAQPLGEETGGLQPPIQLGGGPLEGLPPRPQPIAEGGEPIDLVQREPGLYALPEEKMRADVERQEAIERGEVLRKEPRGLLRRGAEMFLGEGPVSAVTHPIETAKLAAEGYTRPLEELGQEVSKQALAFGAAAMTAGIVNPITISMATRLGPNIAGKLLPALVKNAAIWSAFQLPFAMTGEVPQEKEVKEEAGVAHAIAFDPSVMGERPGKLGPPSPADVAEDLAWAGAMGAGFGLLGKVFVPAFKGLYRVFGWPFSPLKPYWAKVADLVWESHSIPTIAGIGAVGATVGALTDEEPLEGALKGAGLALGGKALIESGHLPNIFARKLTQVVQGGKGLTTEKVFKTLGETFKPAIERMREGGAKAKQVAATFRSARVQETFTKNLSRDVKEATKDLLPSERIEFIRGLSGTPSAKLKSSAAQAALQEVDITINKLGLQPLYEDAFRKHFGELMVHPLEQATSSLPLRTIMSYTKQFERRAGLQSGQVTYTQAQNLLDEIITHPTVNPEMKKLAVQLYDMTAMTPVEAAKASSHAMETFLIDKLVKNPGVVSPVMKLGFVESIHPKIKGMYVSRDLELELEGMMKMHRFANDLYQKFFLTPWKTNKVVLRPAAHFRNLMSNVILNDWGGLPFWRQDVYIRSLNEVLRKGPLFKEFTRLAGETRFATGEEFFRPLANARHGDSVADMIYRIYDGAVSPARSAYAAEETWAKLAKYIHNRELGMNKVEAAVDAVKWTFNYQEVTPALARLRTAWWGAPFATWTSKAIPLTAETAVKHPLRFGKWVALGYYLNGYALNQIGMSEEEWESMKKVMPDYIGKSLMLMLPYRGAEGELKMLNLTWMIPGIGDLAEIRQKGEESPGSLATIAFQNPVGNILAAWKLNKKFGGAPIWHDWESYPTQAAKMLNYAWQQWAPAVVPGGADWKAVYNALTEAPEAPSPEEALAGQFGLRITTVSPEAAFRRKAALDKIHRAEIMQEMRRQLRFATSPEEQEEIVRSAQEYLMSQGEEEEED